MTELLGRMELALTHMVWHGRFAFADQLEPVVEALYDGHTVFAVMLAEEAGWPALASALRKAYDVRKFE